MPYDNTNTGMLSRNERKQQPNHPDFSGTINVAGVDYWLSGWLKVAGPQTKKPGMKFFSLSVRPKDATPAQQPAQSKAPAPAQKAADAPAEARAAQKAATDDLDEDSPF